MADYLDGIKSDLSQDYLDNEDYLAREHDIKDVVSEHGIRYCESEYYLDEEDGVEHGEQGEDNAEAEVADETNAVLNMARHRHA